MEPLPSSAIPGALALVAAVGGAPPMGAAELAELRSIGPAVVLGERDESDGSVLAMVLCGRSPVQSDVYGIVWLGVHPVARGVGLGSALLAEAEAHARAAGAKKIVVGGRPGGYLAPGVDASRPDVIAWLEKRGYVRTGVAADMRVALGPTSRSPGVALEPSSLFARGSLEAQGPGSLSPAGERAGVRALVRDGYLVRRAKPGEPRVASWVGHHFGRGWRHEVSVALAQRPAAVHVVEHAGRIVGFAAHSARLAGLGTFGPTGVLPRHRGKGIGQALLWRCLHDLHEAGHDHATIAWVGPRDWYAKACGAVVDREYVTLARTMT